MKNDIDLFYQIQLYQNKRNLCPVVFTDEHFVPHPKYPRYLISNYGRVYDTINKYMKIPIKRNYICYDLDIGIKKSISIGAHRLVLQTFCPVYDETGLVPNHKNFNKYDNRLCNLEWVTNQENNRYVIKRSDLKFKDTNNFNLFKNICVLLAKGKRDIEIARILGLAFNTNFSMICAKIKGNKQCWSPM